MTNRAIIMEHGFLPIEEIQKIHRVPRQVIEEMEAPGYVEVWRSNNPHRKWTRYYEPDVRETLREQARGEKPTVKARPKVRRR